MVVDRIDGDRHPASRYRLLLRKRCAAGRHHPQRGRRLDGCSALARISHERTSKPTKRFTYGYGRVQDLASIATVITILFGAVVAGHESISPPSAGHAVSVGGGCSVTDRVCGQRDRCGLSHLVGKEIGIAALIADGHHARTDDLTSLAVFFGAVGGYPGFPLADPPVRLAITLAILSMVWGSGKGVFTRSSTASIPPFPTRFGMPPCTPKA